MRIGRVFFVVVLVHSAACSEEARAPFVADLTYEQVAVAGGQDETNDLFIAGSPVPWLVDSTVVTYADQAMGGRLTVADMVGRAGWSISHPRGVDGPGELNGHVPLVSSSGDTVKTLRGDGRLAARLIEDGTLLYDSVISHTIRPGMMRVPKGIAGNRLVSEYVVEGDPVELGILVESVSADPLVLQLETVSPEADGSVSSPFIANARGDLVVYVRDQTVTTLDVQGREIARRQVPWHTFYPFIDGTGRVWVQVFGGVREGMNLMLLTRELELIGQAIIPGFRDAYGDYVLSVRRDSLDVQTMILSRLMH